jgi:dihydrofolate reductase
MRKLIVSNLVTADGFFEGPNQELDWFMPNQEFSEYVRTLLDSVSTLLFGRITYQKLAGYWPTSAADQNDPTITHKMNSLSKIIFSTTLSSVEWNNSILIKENVTDEIKKLKVSARPWEKDMVILGSGTIVSAFAEAGLIDEYRIIVNPVLIGNGNHLFKNSSFKKQQLDLIKTRLFSNGVIILYYQLKKHIWKQ